MTSIVLLYLHLLRFKSFFFIIIIFLCNTFHNYDDDHGHLVHSLLSSLNRQLNVVTHSASGRASKSSEPIVIA